MTTALERAEAFIAFCDGAEQFGFVDYARRGRAVARELIDALDMLDAERSARRAVQERHEWFLEHVCGPVEAAS